MDTPSLIRTYYQRFNDKDLAGFLQLLSPQVVHAVSQGSEEVGKEHFERFMQHMNRCYDERVYNLEVMVNPEGNRAAAEFDLEGRYLQQDGSFPSAHGQPYTLRVGAFFEVRDGLITRISNHYNLQDWLRQVS